MSCYLRHIRDVLDEAGVRITPANRKQIDQAIGVAYKSCPAAWKKIKEDIKNDEEKRRALINQLQMAMRQ